MTERRRGARVAVSSEGRSRRIDLSSSDDFNTWMGWHWNTFLPGGSVPVQEEETLDKFLEEKGVAGLEMVIGKPNVYRRSSNSAFRRLDEAAAATQKALQDLRTQVGAKCWEKLMEACK